jgi:HlyD family secretion protein
MGQDSPPKETVFKPKVQWAIAAAAVGTLVVSGLVIANLSGSKNNANSQTESTITAPEVNAVTALGRLEPQGEVIKLTGTASVQGARVLQILVSEGDNVRNNQVIAILDSRDRLQASLDQSIQQIKVAQANLDKVKAGAKIGEIQAQQATVERLKAQREGQIRSQEATVSSLRAQLENATKECQRYDELLRSGAIAASTRDVKCLDQKTTQERLNEANANLAQIQQTLREQINEANANLNRIAEVRPVDVQQASAEVEKAIASRKQAQAELELAYVRAPIAGKVLKISARPGEIIGNSGIVELGQTDQMLAIAEIYESDISKVKVGQQVTITSETNAFTEELRGTVSLIGLQIGKKDILSTDPSADVDARVVEVKIRLDPESSRRVSGLTNSKVLVKIYL